MYSLHCTNGSNIYEQNYVVFSITEPLNMQSWAGVICFLDASRMMLFHRHVTSHCCVFHLFSNVIPVSHHSLLPALLVANLHPSSKGQPPPSLHGTPVGGHPPPFLVVILHPSWWSSSTHPPPCSQPLPLLLEANLTQERPVF